MKKLSRTEMKKVTGGMPRKFIWSCYGSSDGGIVTTCSTTDPTALCAGCGYSDCTNTGSTCFTATFCVC